MDGVTGKSPGSELRDIEVRFWAAARAAAGVAEQSVPVGGPLTLADLVRGLCATREDGRLARLLPVCAVLVSDVPVAGRDPAEVVVRPGDRVEFLPPFAGG